MEVEIKLWEIRKDKNVSLRELEEKTSIGHSTLNRIENGQTSPTLDELGKIAEALSINPNELFNFIL